MDSIINYLVDLIIKPGTSLNLVPVINISILALLVLMACLLYSKIAVIHIIVMSTLAVGLLASVNWVYAIVQSEKNETSTESDKPTETVAINDNKKD